MKSFSFQCDVGDFSDSLDKFRDNNAGLVLFFTSSAYISDGAPAALIQAAFPDAFVLGCSTSGEIGASVEDDSISVVGMTFEKTAIRCASVDIAAGASMQAVGSALAKDLAGEDISGLFVLAPGVNINGSELTRALRDNFPSGISISGGLAGDGLNFARTYTVMNDKVSETMVVAFALYGKDVLMRSRSKGGWKPFGPLRRVTKARQNVLYELDGKPALDLYKQYLGDKAAELPSSGLLYPFAIMQEDGNSVGLIRTILNIDNEQSSLVLAGDMEDGQLVCLMHGNTEDLVDAAEDAASQASEGIKNLPSFATICVSCVGRKILMGDDTEEELDAVREVILKNATAGFYSYGEIALADDTGRAELHNQTMTITCIGERG